MKEKKHTNKQNKNARIVFDAINNPRSATMWPMVCVPSVVTLMSSDRQ